MRNFLPRVQTESTQTKTMKTEVITIDGKPHIQITAPIDTTLPLTTKGRAHLLVTSHGWCPTVAQFNGKPVTISLNVIIKK